MSKKLANDLMQSNTEYTKLKGERPDGSTPCENPDHQSPNQSGLHKPNLDEWTNEELANAAQTLEMKDADKMSREELIEKILLANNPRSK